MKGIKKIDENLITPERSLTITNPALVDNKNWQKGTLKCDPTNHGLQHKIGDNKFSYFNATKILLPRSVNHTLIADHAIRNDNDYDHLSDECVTNNKVHRRTSTEDTKSLDHFRLQYRTITNDELAKDCVDNRALANNSVATANIQNEAVTCDKIASTSPAAGKKDLRIKTANLQDNVVTSTKLASGAVYRDNIVNGEVINEKLAEKAVTWDKISPYSIYGGEMTEFKTQEGKVVMGEGLIAEKTITNWNIADLTINTDCMMNGAVTNRVIGQFEVYGDRIAPEAIKPAHIEANSLTSAQIMPFGIETESYNDFSITKKKLANNVASVIDNAVVYDESGNVKMLKGARCEVSIGSEDANGKSKSDGYLRVYGDIKADRVYNMSYSDLAEGYIPGEELEAGDIVELREDGKVYKAFNSDIPSIVVGVVSDEFAACYGATREEIEAGEKVAVGLIGKVHVKVNGKVKIGQAVRIGNMPGVGALWSTSDVIIGKALETSEIDGVHKVLCLIKPF